MKDTAKRMRRLGESICKEYISKIYTERLKLGNKKITQFKRGQRSRDISMKKISRWQVKMWKDVQHHKSSGKYKLKQQDINTHLSQCYQSKIPTTPNAGEDVEQHCWWECKMICPT